MENKLTPVHKVNYTMSNYSNLVLIEEAFKESYVLFKKELTIKNIPISCQIHDTFDKLDVTHNCIGCNFAESIDSILRFLKRHKQLNKIEYDFQMYILLLYLLIERIEVIFSILTMPESYRHKHFFVFYQIRRWANFIKHPKAFILTHHPSYDFEGSNYVWGHGIKTKIDNSFVKEYYKSDSKNNELYKLLTNKGSILVMYPNPIELTKKFCSAFKKFVDVIVKNEVYIEVLNDKTSLAAYFETNDNP